MIDELQIIESDFKYDKHYMLNARIKINGEHGYRDNHTFNTNTTIDIDTIAVAPSVADSAQLDFIDASIKQLRMDSYKQMAAKIRLKALDKIKI